ncbi:hypothetical protein [Leptospira fainei]|nr:hypothetical protein [Leptospira fainei]
MNRILYGNNILIYIIGERFTTVIFNSAGVVEIQVFVCPPIRLQAILFID